MSDFSIDEMRDRSEIWHRILSVARGCDRFDRDLVLSAYHPDAIDNHASFAGSPEEFIDWAFAWHKQYQKGHHHALSNHWCEIDGDVAHTETYYTFFAVNREGPHTIATGRYIDRLEKRDGRWAIADRVCVREMAADVALSEMAEVRSATIFDTGPCRRDKTDISYRRPLVIDRSILDRPAP